MNPRTRWRLQRIWQRYDRLSRELGTIRSGDYLSRSFASFGDRSRIEAPRVSLHNPGSVAIGNDVYIRSYFALEALAPAGTVILRIGDHVELGHGVRIVAFNGIEIEQDVGIGHNVTIADTVHDKSVPSEAPGWQTPPKIGHPLRIERGATIGNNNVITGGFVIGARSITAPNSVITRDVPAGVIVAGTPLRVIRRERPDGVWERLPEPMALDDPALAQISDAASEQ